VIGAGGPHRHSEPAAAQGTAMWRSALRLDSRSVDGERCAMDSESGEFGDAQSHGRWPAELADTPKEWVVPLSPARPGRAVRAVAAGASGRAERTDIAEGGEFRVFFPPHHRSRGTADTGRRKG
jgi:hypothetical protein